MNANKLIYILVFLVFIFSCKNKEAKIAEVNRNIQILKNYHYAPNETINPIELSEKTANLIVDLTNNENYKIENFAGLELNVEVKNKVKIYSFGFDGGGTGGSVFYSIIQWNHNKRRYTFRFSNVLNYKFDKIIVLKNDLYLLIGHDAGSIYQSLAYVVEIKNDTINLDYAAFINRPYLVFNNGEFIFNEKTKVLSFIFNEGYHDDLNTVFYSNEYGKFKNDTITAKKLKEMIEEQYYKDNRFHLVFNDKTFITKL
jgi:hypothetical protein